MKTPFIAFKALLFSAVLFLAACSKSNDDGGTSTVNFHLTDGPGAYDAIYLDIKEVQVHTNTDGWVTLGLARPGIYNLLKFSNGLDTLLCRATIPSGNVSQMRLILNSNNSIVVNGTSYPLSTPSAEESGVKLNLNTDFQPNGSYNVWLDFDAGKSIVVQGNGSYKLKPVIRAYSAETNGKIAGTVLPLTSRSIVYASNGVDTYAAIPDATGYFLFSGLPAGTYTVTIDADGTLGFQDKTITNVNVSFGVVTNIGIQQL
jgi:hypothetical protein